MSWVQIPLEPQNFFFWALVVTALVTSQLQRSKSEPYEMNKFRVFECGNQTDQTEGNRAACHVLSLIEDTFHLPSSLMLSMMVMSFFSLAIDSCSFPLDRKSLLNPGIMPWRVENELFLLCFFVQIKHRNWQKHELCLPTTWTPPLESTHWELSFEWSHL